MAMKYHNKRTSGFASKAERNRNQELLLMQKAGVITGLDRQVKFTLVPAQYENGKCVERAVNYYADFTYWKDGKFIIEDVKGVRTPEYIIKRKLMRQRGYKITEVKV